LGHALTILDAYLLDKTYLVGHSVTLADICLVSALLYPFKLVADKNYVKNYPNVMRWFNTCVNQPEFVAVIGTVTLCKKELLAPGQTATPAKKDTAATKTKEPKAAKAKKEKEQEEEPDIADVVPEKKAEHPYKIMDREHPSPFSMDAWKKTYSNAANYDEAMAAFWETFDPEGWTLYHQTYNYNEDNKRIFMTANAIGGFQQRTDEIRKWAFGVQDVRMYTMSTTLMWCVLLCLYSHTHIRFCPPLYSEMIILLYAVQVLGTEETVLEIAGVWLLRGHTVEHMTAANDDANWYTWTPLSFKGQPVSDENKKLVEAFWTSEDAIDGKPIQDSKVFK
jgi:elongation factor 1-gamma